MKKKAVFLSLLFVSHTIYPNLKAIGAIGIGTVGLYAAISWFRKPGNFKPTIENLNTVTIRSSQSKSNEPTMNIDQLVRTIYQNGTSFQETRVAHQNNVFDIQAGIILEPTDNTVCVFSRGYAKVPGPDDLVNPDFYDLTQYGGGAKGALIQSIDNIAPNVPIIGFDYADDRRNFSMGARQELECLNFVMKKVEEKNSNANIILIADCRGAGVALRYAAMQKDNNLKALVLMSPFVSGRELSDQIANNYLPYLPFAKQLLHAFFRIYYPCYHPAEHDTVHAQLKNISPDLPILIAYRKKDSLISNLALERLRDSLQHSTKLSLIELDDTSAPHSKLTHLKELQKSIHTFYQEHNLPYKPEIIQTSYVLP
jgi:hypothetical protein